MTGARLLQRTKDVRIRIVQTRFYVRNETHVRREKYRTRQLDHDDEYLCVRVSVCKLKTKNPTNNYCLLGARSKRVSSDAFGIPLVCWILNI